MATSNANKTGTWRMLAEAEVVPHAPLILIAEEQPAISELLQWTLHLAEYDAIVCIGRQAAQGHAHTHPCSTDSAKIPTSPGTPYGTLKY